ncbi:polyprenyl synthetase family protein, partial [Campylobacter jejuni]|nr:polyprenyl synthetase family protein [Campylobacter jejuni]
NEKEWLKTKFEEQKALEKAILEAKTYAKKARKAIEKYDNNKLNDIIKAMIDREF